MKIWIALLILIFAVSVSAQAPQSDNLVNAIKALQQEIENTRAEVKALRVQQEKQAQQQARRERRGEQPVAKATVRKQPPAQKKHEEVGRLISERESRLEAVELTLAELAGATPEERKRAIAAIVIERQLLQEKVKKANQSWGCRLLRIGCIGRK